MVKRLEERQVVGRLRLKQCIFCLFHNLEHPFQLIAGYQQTNSIFLFDDIVFKNNAISEVEVMLVLKVSGTYKWGQKEFNNLCRGGKVLAHTRNLKNKGF